MRGSGAAAATATKNPNGYRRNSVSDISGRQRTPPFRKWVRRGKNGVSVLYDDIAIDNPSITLFLRHGFVEEYRTDEIIMLKKEL